MKDTKKYFVYLSLFALFIQFFAIRTSQAQTFNTGDVVINEIAWAGSQDAAGDEWIELYNNTNTAINLSGWCIDDDNGSSFYCIESGTIPARSYFLIESNEDSVSNKEADAVIKLSLANTGDSLVLKDAGENVIDTVNGSGGAWYAGHSTSKATMERIDPSITTDVSSNWASALFGNGSKSSGGSDILGTPGSLNSVFAGSGTGVEIKPKTSVVKTGDTLNVSVDVFDAEDLYAYGFEIIYDPSVLNFSSSNEGAFLSADGTQTFFSCAKENGIEGKLVVGASRLVNPETGIDGSGNLFDLSFNVVGVIDGDYSINFGTNNFLADIFGDIAGLYYSGSFTLGEIVSEAIKNLTISPGSEKLTLELKWSAPTNGADSYIIKRKNVNGVYTTLGEGAELSFIDDYAIIPNIEYHYQVIAVKNGILAPAVGISGFDTRGILGDNDRNGRVDGRDIERLARSFGSAIGEAKYDPLLDSSYDGFIDGIDLIDIGANFGLTY